MAGCLANPLLTVGTIGLVWLIVCEVVASALGGYLTGRLRTKWALLHNDEVFFRDTANGFLAWAVALAGSAVFSVSAAASMAGVVTQARPMTESTGASTLAGPNMYFVDTLFRSDRGAETNDNAAKAEAERILANDLKLTQMPASDQSYLARLVATRTGIAQAEAEKRVADVISDAREKEDAVRKATARLLLWLFVSLMLGAFIASYAATIGGLATRPCKGYLEQEINHALCPTLFFRRPDPHYSDSRAVHASLLIRHGWKAI